MGLLVLVFLFSAGSLRRAVVVGVALEGGMELLLPDKEFFCLDQVNEIGLGDHSMLFLACTTSYDHPECRDDG